MNDMSFSVDEIRSSDHVVPVNKIQIDQPTRMEFTLRSHMGCLTMLGCYYDGYSMNFFWRSVDERTVGAAVRDAVNQYLPFVNGGVGDHVTVNLQFGADLDNPIDVHNDDRINDVLDAFSVSTRKARRGFLYRGAQLTISTSFNAFYARRHPRGLTFSSVTRDMDIRSLAASYLAGEEILPDGVFSTRETDRHTASDQGEPSKVDLRWGHVGALDYTPVSHDIVSHRMNSVPGNQEQMHEINLDDGDAPQSQSSEGEASTFVDRLPFLVLIACITSAGVLVVL